MVMVIKKKTIPENKIKNEKIGKNITLHITFMI